MIKGLEPHLVYRAGMIPYYVNESGDIEMLFMRPTEHEYSGFVYQIAKGRVEDEDTSFEEAALREAREELGVLKSNIMLIDEVGTFMGRTTVFVAKVNDKDLFGVPSFETESVSWMTLPKFLQEGRELHRPVISAAYRHIKRLESIE